MRHPRTYHVSNLSQRITTRELVNLLIVNYSHELLDNSDIFVPIIMKIMKRDEKKWLYRLSRLLPIATVSSWSQGNPEILQSIFVHINSHIPVNVKDKCTKRHMGIFPLMFDDGKIFLSCLQHKICLSLHGDYLLGDSIEIFIDRDVSKVFQCLQSIVPEVLSHIICRFLF